MGAASVAKEEEEEEEAGPTEEAPPTSTRRSKIPPLLLGLDSDFFKILEPDTGLGVVVEGGVGAGSGPLSDSVSMG